jgi:hypothetical protein
MALNRKLAFWALIPIGAMIVGGLIGWLAIRAPEEPDLDVPQPVASLPISEPKVKPQPQIVETNFPAPEPIQPPSQFGGPVPPGTVVTNWSEKFDQILESELEDPEKVDQALAMFSVVPVEGQIKFVELFGPLVPDEQYQKLNPLLVSEQTSPAVQQYLFSDLLGRGNYLKLGLLLNLAKAPTHPLRGEAHDLLKALTEQDHGNDWRQWDTAIQEWLTENGL